MLYEKGVCLQFTEHLSDRELYSLIMRDILTAEEKQVFLPGRFLNWCCIDARVQEQDWLRFYASDDERFEWAIENEMDPPDKCPLPFSRYVPRPRG